MILQNPLPLPLSRMKPFADSTITWLTEFKGRLFATYQPANAKDGHREREPLTKISLVVILLLDIFLFGIIYDGLEEQGRVIETPDQYASYRCRDTIENMQRINEPKYRETVAESLFASSSYSRNKISYGYYDTYMPLGSDTSLECQNIGIMLTKVDNDSALQSLYQRRFELSESIRKNTEQTESLRSNYDTKLLEKMAGQDPDLAIDPGTAATTKLNLERLATEKMDLDEQLVKNTSAILANPNVAEMVELVKNRGAVVLEEYSVKSFWYPVKVLGIQALFLLPLLLIVAIWSNRALVRGRPYQLLIASHLLAILGIFITLKLLELVYDIIPHKFIADFIDWLISIQLV